MLFLTELLVARLERRSSFGSYSLSRRIASVSHAVFERGMTAYLEAMVVVSKIEIPRATDLAERI